MENTKYTLHVDNYTKPTPYKLKLWADIGLLVGIITDSMFATMPSFEGDQWVKWLVPLLAMIFKLVTTFVAEHPKDEPKE